MTENAKLKRHADLFDTMAERLGHNIQRHVLESDLTMDEVVDAVLRCTGCTHPEDCALRLAKPDPMTAAPSYCQNAEVFDALSHTKP